MDLLTPAVHVLVGRACEKFFESIFASVVRAADEKIHLATLFARYSSNFTSRYDSVHIIGMSHPISLASLYTRAHVVTPDHLSVFEDVNAMEQAFSDSGRRQPLIAGTPAYDAIQVANRYPHLNILGAPGAGKSTLLKKIGIDALLAWARSGQKKPQKEIRETAFRHALLPVYIELKQLQNPATNIESLLADEFVACGIGKADGYIDALLKSGRFIFLLDGLDEVPNDSLAKVCRDVSYFVDEWTSQGRGNRFVTSCRTAHYKKYFPRFVDMVIADFDDNQIEVFAANWFSKPEQQANDMSGRFIDTIYLQSNAPALELARTPLLLAFLCMTFMHIQELPPTRATLYRRALDLLLREWGASKFVHTQPIYASLTSDLEIVMLSSFAYALHDSNRFFFERNVATVAIRDFMQSQTACQIPVDADKIFEAIEVQQGLIVRRSADMYSFSHLTIQEYLAARHLWESLDWIDRTKFRDYVFDVHWSVVIELMAGVGDAGRLLLELLAIVGAECERQIAQRKSVGKVFRWIDRIAGQSQTAEDPQRKAACRAILFSMLVELFGWRDRECLHRIGDLREDSMLVGRELDRRLRVNRGLKANRGMGVSRQIATLSEVEGVAEWSQPIVETNNAPVTWRASEAWGKQRATEKVRASGAAAVVRQGGDVDADRAKCGDRYRRYLEILGATEGFAAQKKVGAAALCLQNGGGVEGVAEKMSFPKVVEADIEAFRRLVYGWALIVRCAAGAVALRKGVWNEVCDGLFRRVGCEDA